MAVAVPERRTNCSIARALELVGEKWTFLVLREAFNGVRRFEAFQAGTGAPRQVLTARLATLVEEGLLRREPYREPGQRQRHGYRLTAKGLELYPVLVSLLEWGDRHLSGADGPPVVLTHRGCGEPVHLALRCAAGTRSSPPGRSPPYPAPGRAAEPGQCAEAHRRGPRGAASSTSPDVVTGGPRRRVEAQRSGLHAATLEGMFESWRTTSSRPARRRRTPTSGPPGTNR